MVNVILAGMNVDKDQLDALLEINESYRDYIESNQCLGKTHTIGPDGFLANKIKVMTPESIAAAYARISRNPEPVNELRVKAREDVEAARKSVSNITHDMGHSSIAEHIVFNFDILGLSRRAIEELERHRLNAYTEKSQRYITLDGDYVIPTELDEFPELKDRFIQIIENQNALYNQAFPKINEMLLKKYEQGEFAELFKQMNITDEKAQKRTIEGWAKEDARYCLSMATEGQLGTTINGRNLERMITEFRSSQISEVRELGDKLAQQTEGIAPSLLKYTQPTDYYQKTRKELGDFINELLRAESEIRRLQWALEPWTVATVIKNLNIEFDSETFRKREAKGFVWDSKHKDMITQYSIKSDDLAILAGLVYSSIPTTFEECLMFASNLPEETQKKIIAQAVKYQTSHDPKLREWELGGHKNIYEILGISSSAFAQLKRHRINTLIAQDYNPGATVIPENVKEAGFYQEYMNIASVANEFYEKLKTNPKTAPIADYVLTNGHMRRVLLAFNNRQLHAIANERENLFAQWDIRNLMTDVIELAKQDSPITSGTACGKHEYEKVKKNYCSS